MIAKHTLSQKRRFGTRFRETVITTRLNTKLCKTQCDGKKRRFVLSLETL